MNTSDLIFGIAIATLILAGAFGILYRVCLQPTQEVPQEAEFDVADEIHEIYWRKLAIARVEALNGSEESLRLLCDLLLTGKYPSIRVMAAAALEEVGDRRAVVPLIQALCTDSHRGVRRSAAAALATLADSRSTEALIQALSDPEDKDTRLFAIKGLQNIGLPAHSYLLPLLKSEDASLRLHVTAALGDEEVFDELRQPHVRNDK